jgi:hypothetical protein
MSLETETEQLSAKVSAAIRDSRSAAETLRWLVTYGQRAQELLCPTPKATGSADDQNTDFLKSMRRFANCQRVVDFCEKHKLVLPHGEFWWWLSTDRPGHLQGFQTDADGHTVRGIARITNGIELWIERDNATLFKCHREWWRYDRKPSQSAPKAAATPKSKLKTLKVLEEFLLE